MNKLKKIVLISLGVLVIVTIYLFYTYPYLVTEKTPFTDIIFNDKKVFVEIDGKKYELLSAEDESIEKIQNFAKKKYADKWQHRISDDYILLMKDMGHWTFFSTHLQLKDGQGNRFEKSVSLSEENRVRKREKVMSRQKVQRKHTLQIPNSLKYITQRVDGYQPKENVQKTRKGTLDYNLALPMDSWIPKELAIADLESFEYQLQNTYSYADLKGVNYSLVIDAIITDLQNGISKRDLGIQIKRLLGLFGDGHSRISRSKLEIDSLFLPFNIKKIDGKYYAVSKGKLFNKKQPEILSIDGFSMPILQEKAGEMATKGSPQLYESVSLTYLSYYGFLQKQLNIKNSIPKIQFTNGTDTITTDVALVDKKEMIQLMVSTKSEHKLLENNIGYIYLDKMEKNEDYLKWLQNTMEEFKNTKALIIDIRGNGGGSRKPIYTLLPYFITSPKVINVNALRINKDLDPNIDEPIGELEKRMAYPEKSTHWTAEEREAIANFKTNFNPEWKFDKDKFSKWHYSVVSPNKTPYNKPVYVLMDNENFSASDIFLSAFQGTKNITLIGEKSSGGSGFASVKFLENSGLTYLLSRMASFQPNGKLYDGNGVTPDIEIKEKLDNFGKDIALEKAIQMIK
jgi:hypothetical protein